MGKNVLIVDDVSLNRKLIKTILQNAMQDISILEADDGFKALEVIKNRDVNVIILDIMMPGMDGLEVLEKVKSTAAYRDIPVIMCSAMSDIDSIRAALSLGALDYFTKPLTEEQLRITLPLKVKNALEYYQQKMQLTQFYEHIKDEMLLAEQIQKSLISEYSSFEGAEMWGKYIPCENIGGDIFCCKEIDGKVWFMIADISGHGISAAMVSTMLTVMFNTSLMHCKTPGDVLKNMNKTLLDVFEGMQQGILSAFVGCIVGNILYYANAGHPYPVLVRTHEEIGEEIRMNGLLLGVCGDVDFATAGTNIHSGDTLVLYTDGLFDKGQENGFAAWSEVLNFCKQHNQEFYGDISILINKMAESFVKLEGNRFIDDVAIMAIRKK